jgi:hypothetical protein
VSRSYPDHQVLGPDARLLSPRLLLIEPQQLIAKRERKIENRVLPYIDAAHKPRWSGQDDDPE